MWGYIIISIESFGKVQNCNKTILVKANKVKPLFLNNNHLGYTFTKEDSDDTDWFIFEDTEMNRKKVHCWAKDCEKGRNWSPSSFPFFESQIEYLDTKEKKMKIKKVFLDGSSNINGRILFYPGNNETVELPV